MLRPDHQVALALAHARRHLAEVHPEIAAAGPVGALFETPLDRQFPRLMAELSEVYGTRDDFPAVLASVVTAAWEGWAGRPAELRALDARREADPDWFQSRQMLAGVCYVDRWAGTLDGVRARIPYFKELGLKVLHLMPLFRCPEPHSDGGYAVSSYREVNPKLGTMADLRALADALRAEGISLVLDFIFNHTSDEHAWARAARAGDAHHEGFYLVFPDRAQPDAYEKTLREIFPDEHPGAFSPLPDGRWIWTTFHSYQWDLNYANPAVFVAMAREMLAIANVGAEILRMDAVAFIWKRLGTACENLPEAHALIRAFNAVARLAAPGLLFLSEAIVHPDEVIRYVDARECQLAYNPLQMALGWNSLATREVDMLQLALEERHALPQGTAWVNYVRSHDDIGWTFADEDAARLGINGFDHRQFLNRFFVNRFDGSFARGVPFQDNPATGDCRISGTCASLAGLGQDDPFAVARILLLHGVALASGGIPLIYLGDEIGTLNDADWAADPAHRDDSRWVHRPCFDAARHAQRLDPVSAAGRIHRGLRRMIEVRQGLQALAGNALTGFRSGNRGILGFTREGGGQPVLVLANFTDAAQSIEAHVFSAQPPLLIDLLSGRRLPVRRGLTLVPYELVWLVADPHAPADGTAEGTVG